MKTMALMREGETIFGVHLYRGFQRIQHTLNPISQNSPPLDSSECIPTGRMGCDINHYFCLISLWWYLSLTFLVVQCGFLFTFSLERINYSSLAPPSIVPLTQDSANCLSYFHNYMLRLGSPTQVS